MTQLHKIVPPASERAVVGDEPTWNGDDAITVDESNYKPQISRALDWHQSFASKDDYPLNVDEWIAMFRPEITPKELAVWKHNASRVFKTNGYGATAILARIACQGFPLQKKDLNTVLEFVKKYTTSKIKTDSDTKSPIEQVSVQDRMMKQVAPVLSNLDALIDSAFEGMTLEVEAIKADILRPTFKAPQFGLIEKYLDHNIAEWTLAHENKDEQLIEAYAYCPPKRLKAIIDLFTEVRTVLAKQASAIRVRKIMKKRPTDKKKVVKSLKHMMAFPELGLTGIPAVDVLGASIVWAYDTKKKKLVYYLGDGDNSLFVKGTTILGTKTCRQKALRKPKEQLEEFGTLRKNQIMNWFDAIRSKDLPAKGRTNDTLLFLRID